MFLFLLITTNSLKKKKSKGILVRLVAIYSWNKDFSDPSSHSSVDPGSLLCTWQQKASYIVSTVGVKDCCNLQPI